MAEGPTSFAAMRKQHVRGNAKVVLSLGAEVQGARQTGGQTLLEDRFMLFITPSAMKASGTKGHPWRRKAARISPQAT